MLWDKILGQGYIRVPEGSRIEPMRISSFISLTQDDGFIVPGTVSGLTNHGSPDGWLIRLDRDGNVLWHKPYGENKAQSELNCVVQTSDGGFIAAGGLDSWSVANRKGLWVLKLDEKGNIIWDKLFPEYLYPKDIQQTNDGGFVVMGARETATTRTDVFVLRLNEVGEKIWEQVIGGSSYEWPGTLLKIDGAYVVSATAPHTPRTILLYKFQENGQKSWSKTFTRAGLGLDYTPLVHSAPDGGFFILEAVAVGEDDAWSKTWVLRLNAAGVKQWDKLCGPGARATIAKDGRLAIAADTGIRKVSLRLYTLDKNTDCDVP